MNGRKGIQLQHQRKNGIKLKSLIMSFDKKIGKPKEQ